ncbi:MAG: thioredoxin family protein [Pseudomonadota bacterium]
MYIKIFISPDCPKCTSAKKLAKDIKQQKHKVETFDISTIDGLAEASFYQIQTTPFIVIERPDNTLTPEVDGAIEDAGLLGNCLQIVGEE